jgi:hypothetical protein
MSDDEAQEEQKLTYSKIGNLEAVKRAFCNNEFDTFKSLVQNQNPPFKLLIADYNDADEFQGKPDFILTNKNKGFAQVMEDFRPYFFITFVCFKKDNKVNFKSYWVVNSNDDLKTILGSDYESFRFSSADNVNEFLDAFKSGGVEDYVSLNRLH